MCLVASEDPGPARQVQGPAPGDRRPPPGRAEGGRLGASRALSEARRWAARVSPEEAVPGRLLGLLELGLGVPGLLVLLRASLEMEILRLDQELLRNKGSHLYLLLSQSNFASVLVRVPGLVHRTHQHLPVQVLAHQWFWARVGLSRVC